MKPPLAMTTSMTNGIHSRLKTRKIANPLHPFRYPTHLSHSSMQLHIGRDTPDGNASNVVRRRLAVRRSPRVCGARERDPILMSKPCGRLPYSLFSMRYGIVTLTARVGGHG